MKYVSQPDVAGLYLTNSREHGGVWIAVEVYRTTQDNILMVRKINELHAESFDEWSDCSWDQWWGPIERPPDPSLSESERKVFDEYKAVMNWLERHGAPTSSRFIREVNDQKCGAWFTAAGIAGQHVPPTPTRLRDAVLAEIRKEQQ